MDKAILKKFAIESRKDLMEKIKNKINTFYIDEEFKKEQKGEIYVLSNEKHSLSLTNEEYQKRELLIKRIKELSLEQVIEEAAYTWFNRIIAIRYMEINDYLPLTKDNQSLGIRVLSSKDNTPDPEILKFTNLINPDLDIDFKKEKYIELKDDNEKFKYVLLLVCKKLGRVIPQVFDGITDYIDILIPDNLLNDTGFITKIINEVPVENYHQVEIIGWLYQYYNQTEKDRVISAKKAYKKNEIPYATQLFTPDWIVKYMVENSLGRYWVEHNGDGAVYSSDNLYPSSSITSNWKYFIKENIENKKDKLNPTEITFIDPCCGSGHILVYAFEIFYQIYLKSGFNKKDIPELILKNNLYGLDIDDRAGQLSILSVLLKAREYDKDIFSEIIIKDMKIMSIQESNCISKSIISSLNFSDSAKEQLNCLLDNFIDAKEIGSLLKIEKTEYDDLKKFIEEDNTIFGIELKNKVLPLISIAEILSTKYDVVITNPPYMGSGIMNEHLKSYLKKYYNDSKQDLCTAFMEVGILKEKGYLSMINQQAWMFLSSFEKLRETILKNKEIVSLVHLGFGTFGADFGTTTFVIKNERIHKKGIYFRLVDHKSSADKEEKYLFNLKNNNYYKLKQEMFNSIPTSMIGYWLNDNFLNNFIKGVNLGKIAEPKFGMSTADNNRFVRNWFEVEKFNTCFPGEKQNEQRWFPYNNGGDFRKWYGNNNDLVNWKNNGNEMKKLGNPTIRNESFYFKSGLTWTAISSGKLSVRSFDEGFLFSSAGFCLFKDENIKYVLGFLNSIVCREYLKLLSPTINFNVGSIALLPIIQEDNMKKIENIVDNNIELSKEDWDSFETSWDFIRHPLIEYKSGAGYDNNIDNWNYKIKDAFNSWKDNCDVKFNLLEENEEELNRMFIDIYGLKDELTPEVEDKDITIRKADKEREIKSLISYAVGCMFGRYSLDKEGLIYAGGDFDEIYKKCKKTDGGWAGVSLSNYKVLNDNGQEIDLSFEVDNDNVIPITDEAYFSDDIVERFKTFISVVYGEKTLNENLDFIAETLGKKGTETSEDTIRRYFVNDFFNDHVKTYQKRPIYWLFDSGKKNGFKALVYMHRYNENLIPKVRLDYLHRMQTTYEKLLADVNDKLTSELSMTDKKEAQKRQADLNAKLQEIKEYDEKIAHIANQRISIDLDDGVKVNYDKFKDILAKIK